MQNEHGEYSISVVGKTVIVELVGAWNLNTSLSAKDHYINTVNQMHFDKFAVFLDFSRWELAEKEVFEVFKSIATWSDQHSQKYLVFIPGMTIHNYVMEDVFNVLEQCEVYIAKCKKDGFNYLKRKHML